MAIVSYPRRALSVLRVEDSSAEEVLSFLNQNERGLRYELASDLRLSAGVIYFRSTLDRVTTVGLLSSYFLVYDPDRGEVRFVYGVEELRRFGIDPERLVAILPELSERGSEASP